MLELDWADRRWRLHSDCGLYWVDRRTLIVTDTHFGKADHFRRAGVPVPVGATDATLERIDAMLADTAAERLIVLGDFFHASVTPDDHALVALEQWLRRIGLPVVVVPGNHDRHGAAVTRQLPVTWTDEAWHEAGITLRHHPPIACDEPTLAGHLHPAVRLRGRARSSLRVPCFCFKPRLGLLPAIGAFTGVYLLRPASGDRVIAVGDGELIEIINPLAPGSAGGSCGPRKSPAEPGANGAHASPTAAATTTAPRS